MRRLLPVAFCTFALAALVALAAAPAAAQSIFANRGLGLTVEPQGARSIGLGGVSLGLPYGELSWTNPAAAVGLPAAGLLATFEFDQYSARFADAPVDGTAARFPLLLAAFPFGERWAVSAGFGGYLDQNFSLQRNDQLLVDDDTLFVADQVNSTGGVARLRLGAGYRVIPSLSVGLAADVFTGGVTRTAGRLFPGETRPRCCSARWRYSGVGLLASADWRPSEAVAVAVSVTSGGTLDAEPEEQLEGLGGEVATTVPAASYDVPVTLAVGGSARVAASALLALSADWAGWSTLDQALAASGGAQDAWSVQGGVEWDGLALAGRPLPLRLGGRYGALPFRLAGAEFPRERAVTGGTGVVLASGAATVNLAAERGWRSGEGPGFDEAYWRLLLSVSVLGQ
jgi:hypothetical protein